MTITPETSGRILRIDVIENQHVTQGDWLFTSDAVPLIAANGGWWIDANFRETGLTCIRPKMPVMVAGDLYPFLPFQGHVDSLAAGSCWRQRC